jgi:hypothetical protein
VRLRAARRRHHVAGGSVPRAEQLSLVRAAWALVLAEYQAGRDMVNRVLYVERDGSHRFETLP